MSFQSIVAALLIALPVLFAHTEALAQGQPLIRPGPCAHGYFPVCAVKKKTLITYVNSCIAQSVGARVVSNDACQEGCPRNYAPVCTIDSAGNRRTFGNSCEAERAGATIVRNRGCQGVIGRR